ncbi:MAG: hypothetical protein SGI77_17600 [Pirellulaceae bacterium]|nr:hypothetical protein [Pirellulaceae bacterium]
MSNRFKQFYVEENRRTAYHEAGHVAMFWFFELRYYLEGVSMTETEETLARVHQSPITIPYAIEMIKKEDPLQATRVAEMMAMIDLAGPFATSRFGETSEWYEGSRDWLESLNENSLTLLETVEDRGKDDYSRAVQQGFDRYGPSEARIWTFIDRCADWIEEAFQLDGMPEIVEKVAQELIPLKGSGVEELDGCLLWDIMEATWTPNRIAPLSNKPWNRRFGILRKPRTPWRSAP